MQARKAEDFSKYIVDALSINRDTLEFIVLSLAVMLGYNEADRLTIAKWCATNASDHYFKQSFVSDKQRNAAIKNVFRKSLIQTLTQDYEIDKATMLIFQFTHGYVYYKKRVALNSKLNLSRFSIIDQQEIHYDEILKDIDVFKSRMRFNPEILSKNSLSKRHYRVKIREHLLDSPANALTCLLLFILLFGYPLSLYHAYSLYSNPTKKDGEETNIPAIALLCAVEMGMTSLSILLLGYRIRHSVYRQPDKDCIGSLENIVNNIPKLLVSVPQKDKPPIFHLPIFATLRPLNNTQAVVTVDSMTTPNIRTLPKIKTRANYASIMPAEVKEAKPSDDVINIDGITYHRLSNIDHIKTKDFLGLNVQALIKEKMSRQQIEKFKNIATDNPHLVAKKGKTGVVCTKSYGNANPSKAGLFKLKDPKQDVRVHTTPGTELTTPNGETVTLHIAQTIIRHGSKKNN